MVKAKKLPFGMKLDSMGTIDWALFKLGIMLFALFLVSVIPPFGRWVINTHWAWFLVPGIIIWIYIIPKVFKK